MDDIVWNGVDASDPVAVAAMSRYFAELDERFDGGFDPGDALTADAPSFRAPSGGFLVATADGEPVACGGVQRIDDTTAEIKRMWVSGDMRGRGLGRAMLTELETLAAALGYQRVVLDTNSALTEAIAMYRSGGYAEIERYNDNPYARHWFGRDLVTP